MMTQLLILAAVGLAPVPAGPPPDPLAWGYLGILAAPETLRLQLVQDDSPAARAGLRADDQLVRVGTLKPRTFQDVIDYVAVLRPGTVLPIEVRRGDDTRTIPVRVGVRPADLGPPQLRNRRLPDLDP